MAVSVKPNPPDTGRTAAGRRGGRLSRDGVAEAALAYLDRHGSERFSMRRLAEELGVGTMTLYGYFRNKEELLDAVLDVAARDGGRASVEGTWREQLRQIAVAFLRDLSKHPTVVRLRLERPLLRPGQLATTERAMAILVDAGFPAGEAAQAFRLLFVYVFGFAAFNPDQGAEARIAEGRAALASLPSETYPVLASAVDELAQTVGGSAPFEYGLARILDGFEARLAELGRA